jgi:hypothetical protein
MVEGEVQAHLGLYGASDRSVEAPLKTVDLQSGHGSGHERALSGNGERLSTQIRALARQ